MNKPLVEELLVDESSVDLIKKYKHFNKTIFNNRLPMKPILKDATEEKTLVQNKKTHIDKLINNGQIWIIKNKIGSKNAGSCHYGYSETKDMYAPVLITIRKGWDYKTEADLDRVLIHEMCHAFVAVDNTKYLFLRHNKALGGHGALWTNEMKKAAKIVGYDLGGRYIDMKTVTTLSGPAAKLAMMERGEIKSTPKSINALKIKLGLIKGTGTKKSEVTNCCAIIFKPTPNKTGIVFISEKVLKGLSISSVYMNKIIKTYKFPLSIMKNSGFSKSTTFPARNGFYLFDESYSKFDRFTEIWEEFKI